MTSDPAPRASFPAGRSSDERDVLSPRPERGEGRDEAARNALDHTPIYTHSSIPFVLTPSGYASDDGIVDPRPGAVMSYEPLTTRELVRFWLAVLAVVGFCGLCWTALVLLLVVVL